VEFYFTHNIVVKMTEVTRTINNVNDLSTAQSDISSLQDNVNTNNSNITTLQSDVVSINAPGFFWFTNPTLSGTEDDFTPIPWGTINYGNPANLDTTTGMWTCPATGLWQFTFSIYYEAYSGYPSWNLFHNGTHVAIIEQASNGIQYITSLGSFVTPASAGDTFQWLFQFVDDSSQPTLVSGVGNLWQGFMIAPGYTAA